MDELDYEYHSFEELVGIAQHEHNIKHFSNIETAIEILKVHPYYTLVNGYQRALEDNENSEIFREGISLELLEQIHTYESVLSSDILRILLSFETKFKNIIQDVVGQNFGVLQADYLNPSRYQNNSHVNRSKVMRKLRFVAVDKDKVNHSIIRYRRDGNVPPWILVNELMFGELKKWYLIFPRELKKHVANEFNYFKIPTDEFLEFFSIALDILNDFRNGLAHGDVLNKIIINDSVHYFQLKYAFSDKVISEEEFNKQNIGKKDLFGSILLLFMLAPTSYRNILFVQLKSDLALFDDPIGLNSPEIRRLLSIPDRIIERLDFINQELLHLNI